MTLSGSDQTPILQNDSGIRILGVFAFPSYRLRTPTNPQDLPSGVTLKNSLWIQIRASQNQKASLFSSWNCHPIRTKGNHNAPQSRPLGCHMQGTSNVLRLSICSHQWYQPIIHDFKKLLVKTDKNQSQSKSIRRIFFYSFTSRGHISFSAELLQASHGQD